MKQKILALNSRDDCVKADSEDELKHFRDKFTIPKNVTYLLGNSLGVCPREACDAATKFICDEWSKDLIESWNTAGWLNAPQRVGDKIGKLIGAIDGETIVADTATVNIFKCLGTSIQIQKIDQPDRRVILLEKDNFPTDIYVTEGFVKLISNDGYVIEFFDDDNPLELMLNTNVAVILISHVNYRTGKLHDMELITEKAHQMGAHIIWDVCHSVGSVPIHLKECNADFAVGCTYKYLNSGPGSSGFIWINQKHHNRVWQPLCGWFGHEKPFLMSNHYAPANGIQHFLVSCPSIMCLSIIERSIDIFHETDIEIIRRKSLQLGDLFIAQIEEKCPALKLITPHAHESRGSHLSYQHEHAYGISRNLRKRNVIADFRNPNIIRFALTPLYTSFVEIFDAIQIISDVITTCDCMNVDEVAVP